MQLGYYNGMFHCLKTIVAAEGASALYRSFLTTALMNMPYGCIMVAANESARKVLNSNSSTVGATTSLLAGAIAGFTAAAATTPLDVIKTKLQTQSLTPCSRSSGASAAGNLSHIVTSVVNSNPYFGLGAVRGVGTAAASSSASAGCPKLHLPLTAAPGLLRYENAIHAFRRIWVEEGPAGFFRGVGPRMMAHGPAVGISWTAYEMSKNFLNTHFSDRDSPHA